MTGHTTFLFYVLATLIIFASICVILMRNPIYSALCLAGTMIGLGFIYFQLEAYFIAGVQLIVYAGAVMVLFVIVLMLFDLKTEVQSMSENRVKSLIATVSAVVISSIIFWAVRGSLLSSNAVVKSMSLPSEQVASVKQLATTLFTKYVFLFEVLGILLLIIAIGVVAVSRTKGGTHARD